MPARSWPRWHFFLPTRATHHQARGAPSYHRCPLCREWGAPPPTLQVQLHQRAVLAGAKLAEVGVDQGCVGLLLRQLKRSLMLIHVPACYVVGLHQPASRPPAPLGQTSALRHANLSKPSAESGTLHKRARCAPPGSWCRPAGPRLPASSPGRTPRGHSTCGPMQAHQRFGRAGLPARAACRPHLQRRMQQPARQHDHKPTCAQRRPAHLSNSCSATWRSCALRVVWLNSQAKCSL